MSKYYTPKHKPEEDKVEDTDETSTESSIVETNINTEWSYDKDMVAAKIKKIEENLEKDKGKTGHNPFIWKAKHLAPLQLLLKTSTGQTKDNFEKLMALPDKPDTKV